MSPLIFLKASEAATTDYRHSLRFLSTYQSCFGSDRGRQTQVQITPSMAELYNSVTRRAVGDSIARPVCLDTRNRRQRPVDA